jgi:hypothetical protein
MALKWQDTLKPFLSINTQKRGVSDNRKCKDDQGLIFSTLQEWWDIENRSESNLEDELQFVKIYCSWLPVVQFWGVGLNDSD